MVHDETRGAVTVDADGRPVIDYAMNDADRAQLAQGPRRVRASPLRGGSVARSSSPRFHRVRPKSVAELDGAPTPTSYARMACPSPPCTRWAPCAWATTRTAPSSTRRGEHHFVKGLFVADGSLFPTSLGGPPQISIYAFALHLAKHMVERAKT